jgi:hypothetical protein
MRQLQDAAPKIAGTGAVEAFCLAVGENCLAAK